MFSMSILSHRLLSSLGGLFSKFRRIRRSAIIVGIRLGVFTRSRANNNLQITQSAYFKDQKSKSYA